MATKYDGTKKEKLALDLFISLTRSAESFSSRINLTYCSSKLTETQFGTMECLKHLGPMNQKDLSRKLLRSSGNMTLVINNLIKLGYVKKTKSSCDRRVSIIGLTDSGKDLIDSIFPNHVNNIMNEVSHLTEFEQEEMIRLCKKLGLKE